jgi:hypothetical protein
MSLASASWVDLEVEVPPLPPPPKPSKKRKHREQEEAAAASSSSLSSSEREHVRAVVSIDPLDGGGGGIEDPPPPPVPVCLSNIDWSQFKEREPVTDPDFHLMAVVAQNKEQYKENPALKRIVNYMRENRGVIPPFDYVRGIQDIYNDPKRGIRNFMMQLDPTDKTGRRMIRVPGPVWPGRNIWEYTRKHVVAASSFYEDRALTYSLVLQAMENSMLFLGDANNPTVDMKVLDAYNKTTDKARFFIAKIEQQRDTALFGAPS